MPAVRERARPGRKAPHEAGQLRRLLVCLLDPVEELRADDAPSAPDGGKRAKVEIPAVLLRTRREVLEALRVGDDLRGVESLLDVFDQSPRRLAPCRSGQDA